MFRFPHPDPSHHLGKLWRDQEGAGSLRRCQGGALLATPTTAGLRDSIQVKSIQTRRRQRSLDTQNNFSKVRTPGQKQPLQSPGHSGIPYTAPSAFTAQYHVPTSQHTQAWEGKRRNIMLPGRKAMHKGPMRNMGTHMWNSPFYSSKPQSPGSLQLSLAHSLNQRNKQSPWFRNQNSEKPSLIHGFPFCCFSYLQSTLAQK